MPDPNNPKYGIDAAANADDSYFAVIADPGTNIRWYWLEAGVSTYGALISLDGGTTDHLVVQEATWGGTGAVKQGHIGPVFIDGGFSSVQAKNAVATEDYTDFWVNVWS